MPKMFVSVEHTNGEGLAVEIESSEDVPMYYRWYIPTEDPNGLTLIKDFKTSEIGKLWMLQRSKDDIISVQAAPSWEKKDEYIGLTIQEGMNKALENDLIGRVVLEDGKPHRISPDTIKSRINFFVSAEKIYRAEIF